MITLTLLRVFPTATIHEHLLDWCEYYILYYYSLYIFYSLWCEYKPPNSGADQTVGPRPTGEVVRLRCESEPRADPVLNIISLDHESVARIMGIIV